MDFDNENGPKESDHIVILDDGETYSGANGCVIRLDGVTYSIGELLDFYLTIRETTANANTVVVPE